MSSHVRSVLLGSYTNALYLVGISENADGNAYDGKLGVKVAW
ncbi:hypothetical protein [Hyphomicrobium sulfonivorans]|nr:hypothetical protein [Hyphomicrobium sulfonivorans]